MSLVREIKREASAGVRTTDIPEGLDAICLQDCAAVIWNREPLKSFQSWIDSVPIDQLPQTRTILQPGAVRRAMYELCQASTLPDTEQRARLIDDISALANIFADLTQAPYLRLRLELVTTNACRRFHVDSVTTRLVCTYRGPGTQYGVSSTDQDPEHISTVSTGSPILLRGTLWPATPKARLLHRSPPIEGTGATRLVLVLDPITGAENDLHSQTIH